MGALNVLSLIRQRAEHRFSLINQVQKLKKSGNHSFKMIASAADDECEWCQAQDGAVFPIDTDIDKLYQRNCSCHFCRCVAVINPDEDTLSDASKR